ncbi:MAG: hypothetical protein COA49_09140, partial [Bacteroidetes bacterium]
MRFNFSFILALFCLSSTFAQNSPLAPGIFLPAPDGYWLEAQEVTTHTGGALDGLTTWRLYLNCMNETDYLSSVSGDDAHVFELNTTTTWHQDPFGVTFGSEANPAFYAVFPDLAYDSWLTIGAESSSDGVNISSVTGETDPFTEFDAGNNMLINDATGSAWFSPFPGVGSISLPSFAGADLKVLVAQLTTDGDISGQMQLQVFMNADQTQEWRDVLPILFSSPNAGCTDATACNYDPTSLTDDGSCTYIAEGACDCAGNVLDECGVCGGSGIAAGDCDCNGNQLDALGVCGGACTADVDGNGVCDDAEILGCMDATACNYDMTATQDDGSCATLDECGVCGGTGIPSGDCDCNGNQLDALGVCGGACSADVDGDGVCDDIDNCLGILDECGVCNGNGAIYECGCSDIPAGDCDCNGSQLDAIGVCGGACTADVDADGICDDVDDCIGALDECGVCNGDGAIYECGCSDIPAGDCDCNGSQLDALGVCGGSCTADVDADGICDDVDDCVGALDECGVCNGAGAIYECGCSDIPAGDCDCNGSQLDALGVCGGACVADLNGNGICDDVEVNGCTDITACNYNSAANVDDSSCIYAELGFDCNGDPSGCVGCEPVFITDISDYSVQCKEDLPGTCNPLVEAINPCTGENVEVVCQYNQALSSTITNNAETAFGPGADGAFRIYGLSSMYGISASDYFVEVSPLELVRFPATGTARLTGEIACMADASQTFAVDIYFENEQNAVPWLAESNYHTLLTAWNCDVDPAAITVYDLQNTISRLTGTGSLDGQIYLDHMPVSLSKRFQLGVGGNNHNCGYGLGGWFAWQGNIDGQSVSGLSGDIIVDLDADVFLDVQCGGEFADIVYAAIDQNCGFTTVVTQHITRNDTQAPVFTVGPADITVECDAVPVAADPSELAAEDNCIDLDAPVEITYDGEIRVDGSCPDSYELIRRWTASDCTGNASIWEQSVIVQDTTAPSIDPASANAVVECDGAGNESELQAWLDSNGGASASDNCGSVTWSNDFGITSSGLSDDCGATGSVSVTFTATDDCGNASSTTASFTIEDTTAPVLTNDPSITIMCDEYPNEIVYATASDDCGTINISYVDLEVSGGCVQPIGTYMRTYTATDECGNSSTSEQIVTLIDNTAPVFTLVPADYTIECGLALDLVEATATDNCDANVTINYSESIEAGCGSSYTLTRTWVAFDSCDNSTEATQVISVVDTTAPSINDLSTDLSVECDGAGNIAALQSWLDANGNATATDACGEFTWSNDFTALSDDCGATGSAIVTFTVVDGCGNASETTSTFTINDTVAPSIDVAASDLTVECTGDNTADFQAWLDLNGEASASDVCSSVVWTNNFEGMTPECGLTSFATVQFTATDECGNASTTIATFNIEDTTAPDFGVELPETTLPCDDHDVITVDASDVCGDVSITYIDAPVSGGCVSPIGTLLRTYTATDECGNTSSLDQIIVLIDDVAPVITSWPADYTAECSDEHPFDTAASATDNCDSAPGFTISVDTIAGNCTGNFTIIRTFTASDHCDNTSSVMQTITIQDTTAPAFTDVPADYTAECSDAHPFDAASAADLCGITEVTYAADTIAGACLGDYTIIRTFTATDDCGNASTAEQVISIIDTTGPEFTSIPADYTAECSDEHPFDSASAVDNCGTVSITEATDTIQGDCIGNFQIIRVFTATDDCGNATSATQTISIIDTTAPVFNEYENYEVVACDFLTDPSDPTQLPIYAQDNCGTVSYSVTSTLMSGGCLGVWMRIWTATDDCGNSSTAEQFVSLTDFVAPTLEIPADFTGTLDENCEANIDVSVTGQATAYDNCGPIWDNQIEITFVDELISYDCAGNDDLTEGSRTIYRTWTAMDACENTTVLVQVITLLDEIAPTASIEDVTLTCEEYDAATEFGARTEFDNCDSNVSYTWANDSLVNVQGTGCYQALRTYTWVDDCGNETAIQQTITVYDNVAPVMTGDIEIVIACDEYPDNSIYVVADDNCGGSVEVTFVDQAVSGGCVHPVGMYMRTYTATDDCGNSSMFEQFLRLVDETAPVFTYVPADYTIECSDELVLELAEATDNCANAVIIITEEVIPGSCNGEYSLVRTFTAHDDCDNYSVDSQTITVVDTTGPSFDTVPEDYTIECSEALILDMATASDLCSQAVVEVASVEVAGDCANEYTMIRTFTATDECGNTTLVDQTISVVDTTAPEFTFIPADYTAECSDVLSLELSTATDNCGSVEITIEE